MRAHPLRVGYVLNRFPRLSQTFVLNEIRELERQGVEVEVFSLLRPPRELRQPVLDILRSPVTYLPGVEALDALSLGDGLEDRPRSLAASVTENASAEPLFSGTAPVDQARLQIAAATLSHLARARGIDHLHAHFGTDQTTVALLAARLSGLGFSWTAHARDLFLTFGTAASDARMRRIKIAEARFVAAVSAYNRDTLASIAPEHAPRIHHLPNGIDLEAIRPGSGANPSRILAVGRLIEKKGFADLIDAAARLAADGLDFRCSIIGEGPLEEALAARIRTHGLEGRVVLEGPATHPEVLAAMARAGQFVLPCKVAANGDRDGLPTVLIEGMGHALPAVSCAVTGVPEIIEDGVTGRIVPSGDPAALALAIAGLATDPAMARGMGAAGRRRAELLFDIRRNVARLAVLFETACRESDMPLAPPEVEHRKSANAFA